MISDNPVITIDGPAASGKGTLAQRLSADLGFNLLDSGLLYRIVGFLASTARIQKDDEGEVAKFLRDRVDLRINEEQATSYPNERFDVLIAKQIGNVDKVSINGRQVLSELRNEDASFNASIVAKMPKVRELLIPIQHRMSLPPGLIADGRDMGTVVFENAPVKFFLEASVEVRAERRLRQLTFELKDGMARLSNATTQDDLIREIKERDERDRTRGIARLYPATDATTIDSTSLTIDEMFDQARTKVREILNI